MPLLLCLYALCESVDPAASVVQNVAGGVDGAAVDAGFSPEAYGKKTFPEIKKTVTQRAAPEFFSNP